MALAMITVLFLTDPLLAHVMSVYVNVLVAGCISPDVIKWTKCRTVGII